MKHNETSSCHLEISTQRTFNQKIKKNVTFNPHFYWRHLSHGSRCLLALCQGFGILAVLLLTLPGTEVAGWDG